MDRESALGARSHLFNALAILASPADAQIAWLQRIQTFPMTDELAIEFSDWEPLVPQLMTLGLVESSASAAVADVAAALDRIQKAGLWDIEDLTVSPLWGEARSAAGKAVVQLLDPAPLVH